MADVTTRYSSDNTALWLQRTCTSALEFLGCHDVSDLTKPQGDVQSSRKRTAKGTFKVFATRKTAPDNGTVTFTFFRQIASLITDLPCKPNVFVFYSECGSDDDPTNYDFIDVLEDLNITETTQAGVVNAIGADDATDVGVDIVVEASSEFEDSFVLKPLTHTDLTLSTLAGRIIADLAVCDPDPECGDCDNLTDGCQTLWIVTNGSPGFYGDARIFKSTDSGTTWVEQTNSMTTDIDNLSSVDCDGDVVIITNADTAEYQFSNDGGTTMTLVTTPDNPINDVFVLGQTKIWFAADGGDIYFSSDKGASISTQADGDGGGPTAQNLNSIHFMDSQTGYAVGNSNAFVRTTDGGTTWTLVTGPAVGINLNVVRAVPDSNILFVGDAGGELYRSTDNGDTWTTVISAVTAFDGGINDIAICECIHVLVTGQDSDGLGSVRESIDGGTTFSSVAVASITGAETITNLTCCDVNTYFGAGDDGTIFQLSGTSFRDL